MTEKGKTSGCSRKRDRLLDAKATSLSENDEDTDPNGDGTRIQAGASVSPNKRRYMYALYRCRVCLM